MPIAQFALLEALKSFPAFTKFSIQRLDQEETKRMYGPYGDEDSGSLGRIVPKPLPEWHCAIQIQQKCSCCDDIKTIGWPRGHGHTAEEAVIKAFECYNTFLPRDTAGRAFPPEGGQTEKGVSN
jgi:hypothetical protein